LKRHAPLSVNVILYRKKPLGGRHCVCSLCGGEIKICVRNSNLLAERKGDWHTRGSEDGKIKKTNRTTQFQLYAAAA
jgi:hypothetical protein